MPLTFSRALQFAAGVATGIVKSSGLDVRLERDQQGRIIFVFNCRDAEIGREVTDRLAAARDSLGPYSSPELAKKTLDNVPHPDIYFSEGWRETWVNSTDGSPFMIPVKDTTGWGRDWLWLDAEAVERTSRRIVFHGLKGGVGRSTALAVLAQQLAKRGHRVLVLDLDIESPGASGSLLATGTLPAYGAIDWLVEHAVGSTNVVVDDIYFESPLSSDETGSIYVVPAIGAEEEEYISKLGRLYIEINGKSFSDRMDGMLHSLEKRLSPDFVLIDSRAGLHEIAASAISRFADLSLLFFADTEQNWIGYRQLFELWRSRPDVLVRVRERLIAVRALASDSAAPFENFLQRSHDLFSESLYDEVPPGGDSAALFNFDLNDQSAPHFPPIIHMHPRLHERNLLRPAEFGGASEADIQVAFGPFLKRVLDSMGVE